MRISAKILDEALCVFQTALLCHFEWRRHEESRCLASLDKTQGMFDKTHTLCHSEPKAKNLLR